MRAPSLPASSPVQLMIYALDGRYITTLLDAERPAGLNEVVWNGLDAQGVAVSSGTYIYQLRAGALTETRKMNLMK